ncbi:little elongation complex subunit 2 isoform 2-T2 [Pholidichthys leucotaenia]
MVRTSVCGGILVDGGLTVINMDLIWEDHPVPEGPFFTRDLYEKYSLAPTIRELWTSLQSPLEDARTKETCDVGGSSLEEAVDHGCTSTQEPRLDSCDDDGNQASSAEGAKACEDTQRSGTECKPVEAETSVTYPEPRLPFPCTSNLSAKQQKTYVDFLLSGNAWNLPQFLKTRVNNEVMQFMRYLQDVSRICAEDYNFISQGALQYSEDFFRSSLEGIKTLPQLYQIHEMTSLTGGKFNPRLELNFEKQLLAMGTVNVADHQIVPADAQLASDYQSVSSACPPAKKAKDMHATVSGDGNAQKLSAFYEPHVCLTRDALVRLLDNHGPDFLEQWELPVSIKLTGKGNNRRKTVYIDSPLLKTEMTVRDRNHIYLEESLKHSIKKNGSINSSQLMTDLPVEEKQPSLDISQRSVLSFEDAGLDFEVDLTDLETFGETKTTKTAKKEKIQRKEGGFNKSKRATSTPLMSKTEPLEEHLTADCSSSQEDMNSALACMDDSVKEPASQMAVPTSGSKRQDSTHENDVDPSFTGGSDDEKLIIDDLISPVNTCPKRQRLQTTAGSADPLGPPATETASLGSVSGSPQKVSRARRQPKRGVGSGDHLGEILRMQTAMFKSSSGTASHLPKSPSSSTGPLAQTHPASLVKPCVTSFLERSQKEDGEACGVPPVSSDASIDTKKHRKLLSEDLQASAEDVQDYDAPVEGNLFYKLYSLQDLLLMVRSAVSLTHSRKVGSSVRNQYVPVHILPKLEYQLSYGVECITSSEACHLWAETLLHSSAVSYIAHINVHTSKVALLRKLPDDWKQKISCLPSH